MSVTQPYTQEEHTLDYHLSLARKQNLYCHIFKDRREKETAVTRWQADNRGQGILAMGKTVACIRTCSNVQQRRGLCENIAG
jgi:hypothetical protein